MEMTPVTSSQVESVGYDEKTKTMQVQFKRGGLYEYSDVTPEIHERLITADSIGKQLRGIVAGLPYAKIG
jgi:hypothetical protein